ncbi:MAG: YdcF family protein, partial [Anaerolineae bacterium]|nr:YdcF family protein [Anaerolineae bacterium]
TKVRGGDRAWYEPEAQAVARLDLAYALFRESKVDVIISTGRHAPMATVDPEVSDPQTEAEVGAAYLVAKARADAGLRRTIEDCLLVEDQSYDTIGNAWYAKRLCLEPAGITSIIVVTSDYHIERSRVIFEWVLGPHYTVGCAAAPSPLTGEARAQRDLFERALTDFVQEHLVSAIPAGDDAAIARFMEDEHRALLFGGATPPP